MFCNTSKCCGSMNGMWHIVSRGFFVSALSALVLSSLGASQAALAATKVQIFLPTSPIAWGFYLAEKRGYFKRRALT